MKIWTLMENTSCCEEIACEHGLSLYIETGNLKILFDSGETAAFADNAEKMGVDLSKVDMFVLSHGHYDHGGGLFRFMELNKTAPIYISRHAFIPHYSGDDWYVGLDQELMKQSDRFVFVDDELKLADGITLYSCNANERPFPTDPYGLNMVVDDKMQPDNFHHEQYLLIEEGEKKILLSGCSHKGVLNIQTWFKPDVLIGGFHFMRLDPNTEDAKVLEASAKELMKYPTVYYTGHCTGLEQYEFLKKLMQEQLNYLPAGEIITL